MTTAYLLTWNPNRWHWDDLLQYVHAVSTGQQVKYRWSTGGTLKIQPGDRLFLLRQGQEPRGILASGTATSTVFQDDHWDDEKFYASIDANYVEFMFDTLLDPDTQPILPRELLISDPELSSMNWDTQSSGITIKPQVLDVLESRWRDFAHGLVQPIPEEIERPSTITAGAKKKITVNAYERNSKARAECLRHYGYDCSVCGFNFEEIYGSVGCNFIHVHHLKPLGEIGEEYKLDPIADLRPVCPNCHAIIHSRRPAYSLDDVREFLQS